MTTSKREQTAMHIRHYKGIEKHTFNKRVESYGEKPFREVVSANSNEILSFMRIQLVLKFHCKNPENPKKFD